MKRIGILFLLLTVIACTPKPNQGKSDLSYSPLQRFHIDFSDHRLALDLRTFLPTVSIVAVGDIMLGNHTEKFIRQFGVEYPFQATRSILQDADIAMGNLEGAFASSGTRFKKRFTFKVPPQFAPALALAGFDVMTLANNHIFDYGMPALKQTIEVLDSLKINHSGADSNRAAACRPVVLESNGYKVAIFSYSMTFPAEFWATDTSAGTCFPYESVIKRTIPHYDSTCDVVITAFHWGRELKNTPRDYQVEMAHRVIDLGSDLVIGHHPHVLQGMEIYKNRLIAYSLGNFCFSSYSRRAVESVMLEVCVDRNGLVLARVIPINVNNYEVDFQPKVLSAQRSAEVIAHLNEYSKNLESPALFDSSGYLIDDLLLTER